MNFKENFIYKDGNLYWLHYGPSRIMSKPVGRIRKDGYIHFKFNKKQHLCHRVIFEMFNGPIPNQLFIDHIDRNKANNRIENLRLATRKENNRNNSSKGFYWNKTENAFMARITIDKKLKYIGLYDTIIDARAAYLQARRKHFGEFA